MAQTSTNHIEATAADEKISFPMLAAGGETQAEIDHTSRIPLSEASVTVIPDLSVLQTVIIYFTLTGITLASSMTPGLLAIALPRMATDVHLRNDILLW